MFNPVLFPQVSNRESWPQTVQLRDADTGELIALTDDDDDPLYSIALEIIPANRTRYSDGYSQRYEGDYSPTLSASLGNGIEIVGIGTIDINLTKPQMQTLRAATYDVYLVRTTLDGLEARQILIGRLPVLFGGRNT